MESDGDRKQRLTGVGLMLLLMLEHFVEHLLGTREVDGWPAGRSRGVEGGL